MAATNRKSFMLCIGQHDVRQSWLEDSLFRSQAIDGFCVIDYWKSVKVYIYNQQCTLS